MRQERRGNHTRFFSKNPNGVAVQQGGGDFKTMFQEMKKNDVDVMSAPEINIDNKNKWAMNAMFKALRKEFNHSICKVPSSDRIYKTCYKPGGTMLLARDRISGRVTAHGTDEYGRWSFLRINRKGKALLVMSLYQVGDSKGYARVTRKTSRAARRQQYSMLCERRRSTRDPRKAFREDFVLHRIASSAGSPLFSYTLLGALLPGCAPLVLL